MSCLSVSFGHTNNLSSILTKLRSRLIFFCLCPLIWCAGVSQGLLPAVYETIGPAEAVTGLGPSYVRLLSPNIKNYSSLIPGTFSGLIKSSVIQMV